MDETVETARAKINLALHVTGRRADGYHLIESLVAFTELGDVLTFRTSNHDSLSISGVFAGELAANEDNLVFKARSSLRRAAEKRGLPAPRTAIGLEKNLPVASGIGGGSADAAACLRGLMRLWDLSPDDIDLPAIAAGLGADVPMCLVSRPLIARGAGENITAIDTLPVLPVVLVNPLEAVATADVFAELTNKNNDVLDLPDISGDLNGIVAALAATRNDLQLPAAHIAPVVDEVLAALGACHPLLARMSGSGATCFGIFHDPVEARLAGELLRDRYPHWWVRSTMTGGTPGATGDG
ncbi:4-(cytidine 5'-diphospho)-2-C-methyl-D-erythritol kinase [Hoeflea poritis]|uniref:4-diphosphocytidyl-2-C-methyl-D-erythritol kinase n=1 Tax=Hoeflea poritis TaxID=2993659 RepID=A0ABT4VJJ5_9HYPH|nr:4-(cytidine 5'-diphospho)-2-C-methyl-D-erythritol kinase [Hoeflea poritis]MDA4844874.1 4-(cytidine 5'-diphospho)-2-C-methyl-D-erythritol kinase [Hoeflea poritis]